MKKIALTAFLTSLVLFTGCTSKKVFEPEQTVGDWGKIKSVDEAVIDITFTAALLENRKVIDKTSKIDVDIDENYRLIAKSDGWIISATIDGSLKLQSIENKENIEEFELKKTIASVSVEGDTLAVLFADNDMALYSLSSKEALVKEKVGDAIAIDSRIASPYFVSGVVIFPTLDGKVVIINPKTKKRLRTAIVSSEDTFNNIIYFDVIDKKVIAATAHKILAMDKEERRAKHEIRSVTYNGENLYLATKQGEIIAMTPRLEMKSKLKFPFAHFLGLIVKDDKVYALEKEGYMIVLPKDLSSHTIYEVDLDEGVIYISDKGFLINNKLILVDNE